MVRENAFSKKAQNEKKSLCYAMVSWRPSQAKQLVSIWENYVDLTTTCEAIASGFQSVKITRQ